MLAAFQCFPSVFYFDFQSFVPLVKNNLFSFVKNLFFSGDERRNGVNECGISFEFHSEKSLIYCGELIN